MKITEKDFGINARLGIIDTKKFKTDYFSLCYTLPMTEYNISLASVLALVLSRGTAKHSTLLDINRHLVSLYDADLSAYISKTASGLTFRISAGMMDSSYASDGCDVFGGTLDFIREMLLEPLAKNGEMDAKYTDSEKKRALDRIRAEINNKDRYASIRATALAYEGTPLALSENGSEAVIESITPKALYQMLGYITKECPLRAVFVGNYTAKKEETANKLLTELSSINTASLHDACRYEATCFDTVRNVCEQVYAKQGRMVLNYSISKRDPSDASPMIFDEIFGSSPVSRLFMNVRERLSLCYYCASSYVMPLGRITVRSGLDEKNKEKAIREIERQIELLSDASNISEDELEMAKLSRVSVYKSLSDSTSRYADWYLSRALLGAPCDVKRMIDAINAVTADDVAVVAREMKLQLSYFLEGIEK